MQYASCCCSEESQPAEIHFSCNLSSTNAIDARVKFQRAVNQIASCVFPPLTAGCEEAFISTTTWRKKMTDSHQRQDWRWGVQERGVGRVFSDELHCFLC